MQFNHFHHSDHMRSNLMTNYSYFTLKCQERVLSPSSLTNSRVYQHKTIGFHCLRILGYPQGFVRFRCR